MVTQEIRRQSRIGFATCTVVFFSVVALFLFSTNMQRGLSHDEHMYVAAGTLLGRGQVPYLDFPYLQMPNLAFIYAALFGLSDYLLLTARLFSTIMALGSLILVYSVVSGVVREAGVTTHFILGAVSVLLIISSPIFVYTSGQAWNHDAGVLFCLGAFALCRAGMRRGGGVRWAVLCGLLVGLAVGTRLLFVFVAPVFAVVFAMWPSDLQGVRRVRFFALYAGGVVLGLLPSLYLFATATGGFLFGNLAYHQANAEFWQKIGYTRAMDPIGKLSYLWDVVAEPGNLFLVLGALALGLASLLIRAIRISPDQRDLMLAFALFIALLLGAFVPDPTWYQYFYAPLPFLVVCAGYCAAALYRRVPRVSLGLYAVLALILFAFRSPFYPLENILSPETWAVVRVHKVGVEIRRYVGSGRILTFAPIYPLEGGLDIYDDFADGPFAWRSITLLTDAERRGAGLMSPEEVDARIKREPPKAILLGFEADLEKPWLKYAQSNHYREIGLGDSATLWLSP